MDMVLDNIVDRESTQNPSGVGESILLMAREGQMHPDTYRGIFMRVREEDKGKINQRHKHEIRKQSLILAGKVTVVVFLLHRNPELAFLTSGIMAAMELKGTKDREQLTAALLYEIVSNTPSCPEEFRDYDNNQVAQTFFDEEDINPELEERIGEARRHATELIFLCQGDHEKRVELIKAVWGRKAHRTRGEWRRLRRMRDRWRQDLSADEHDLTDDETFHQAINAWQNNREQSLEAVWFRAREITASVLVNAVREKAAQTTQSST
jgi:hypothetical protein